MTVLGFDPDEASVERARRNATEAGVADRVRFWARDGAEAAELTQVAGERAIDVATAFECIHDMARPVEVLKAARRALTDDGSMLVVDERTAESFGGEPDEREAYLYGWSVFDCLPTGMSDPPSAETGAVMRPAMLRRYAEEAGFARVDVLPIEHESFRLYLLR